MPKEKKEKFYFDLDHISFGSHNNRITYIVNVLNSEKDDPFSAGKVFGEFFGLTIDLDDGRWSVDCAGVPVWLTTADYKAVGRFVDKVMIQYGNYEVDWHNLYDKFKQESIRRVK